MTATQITNVFVSIPRANDIGAQITPDTRCAALYIGGVDILVGGEHAALRLEATAMEAIAAHAQDVADQLLAWADQVEDARSADATDGYLDNAEPDVAHADDYLAETSA